MGLLSNTPVHHAVPDEYVMPQEKRPEADDELVDPTVTLPVIDLAAGRPRHLIIDEIIKAGKEFGFFQAKHKGRWIAVHHNNCQLLIDPCHLISDTVLHPCVAASRL